MFDLALERLVIFARALLHAHNDVAVHLQKPSIRIPGETRVPGFFRNDFHHFVVHSEIEDRVHHPGHGIARARTNGNEKRPFVVSKSFADRLFDFGEGRFHFGLELRRIAAVVGVEITADFGSNREPRRHGQTDSRHFGQVRALAAQQRLHHAAAVGMAIAEVIHVLRRPGFLAGTRPHIRSRFRRCLPRRSIAKAGRSSRRFSNPPRSSAHRFSFCCHELFPIGETGQTNSAG